jgi:hypothetical protein
MMTRVLWLLAILTGINLVLLVWLLAASREAVAGQVGAPVLRASAIELVDAAGVVRAQLMVTPGGETLLRMRDAKGEVRVKLGASDEGSGLLLADRSTAPGLHVLAQRGTTTLTLTDADGTQRVIRASDP